MGYFSGHITSWQQLILITMKTKLIILLVAIIFMVFACKDEVKNQSIR